MIERRIPDPQDGLLRALRRRSPGFELIEASRERWASVTFTGARVRLLLGFSGGEADPFCAGLHVAELAMPGHIVADICVSSIVSYPDGVRVEIEALTVEDR